MRIYICIHIYTSMYIYIYMGLLDPCSVLLLGNLQGATASHQVSKRLCKNITLTLSAAAFDAVTTRIARAARNMIRDAMLSLAVSCRSKFQAKKGGWSSPV